MLGAILGASVGAIGSIAGGIAQAVQAKKERKRLNEAENRLDKWYRQQKATHLVDTSSMQSALSTLREQGRRSDEALNNQTIRSGATDESRVAHAANFNRGYADAVQRIAGANDSYQQSIEREYIDGKNNIDAARGQVEARKASAITSFVDAGAQLGGAVMTDYGNGLFERDPNKVRARKSKGVPSFIDTQYSPMIIEPKKSPWFVGGENSPVLIDTIPKESEGNIPNFNALG